MKTINKFLCFTIAFLCVTTLQSQTPKILWWFDTNDSSFGQSAMGYIDNDGKPELVFGCYRNDSMIYALNADDGSLLWKYNASGAAEGCNDAASLIYDVDRDSVIDVVVPSSCNPKTFCFNGANGSLKWQTPTRGSDSPPTVADLDNDNIPDILHGEFGGYVICIDGSTGSEKWEILVDPDSWIQTAPTIVDLDLDGQLDFVVATWHFSDSNRIYAYHGGNQTVMWSKRLDDVVYHGTAVADLDKDGKPELIIGDYSGKLRVLKGENGDSVWTYNTGTYIGSPVSVGDIDGDGFCELVFTSSYKVYALNHDGTLLWQFTIPSYNSSFRGVALSDINNDSHPDVIFGTSAGQLIALNGPDSQPIFNMDLAAHYGAELDFDHAPVVGDFNSNDTLDIFIVGGKTDYPAFQTNYGRGYAVELGKGTGPFWPMFQFDVHRTGNLCVLQNADIHEVINQPFLVYPNPSKAGEYLYLNYQGQGHPIHVCISDLTGRVIMSEYVNNNRILLHHQILPGCYIITISNNEQQESVRLIIY